LPDDREGGESTLTNHVPKSQLPHRKAVKVRLGPHFLHQECRAGLNEREAPDKVVTARAPKRWAQLLFTCSRSNFAEAPINNVRTDTIWQPTLQRQLGVTMYGGSYVVSLFKQKVVSQKNELFATVTLHNNLFCHRLSDHLHCTNRPFIYVLRRDMSTLSRRSKRTRFRKSVLNEISRKATWTVLLDWSFAMTALQ